MQLRLELAESLAPAVAVWELVGEEQRQTAMALLTALIAQTVAEEAVDGDLGPISEMGSVADGARRAAARLL